MREDAHIHTQHGTLQLRMGDAAREKKAHAFLLHTYTHEEYVVFWCEMYEMRPREDRGLSQRDLC